MEELTDLEICTRIAEIEGVETKEIDSRLHLDFNLHKGDNIINVMALYNPLTDGALCFQLMVKYEVEATPLVSGVSGRHSAIARVFNGQDDFIEFKAQSGTLNKAICLAIIKAHE